MKRIFAFFLALMLFTCTAAAQDAEVFTSGDFEYTVLDDGTASLKKYTGKASELTIPAELDGKPVTVIGEGAFNYCKSLKEIIIPDGIREVGANPFTRTPAAIQISPEHPWLEVIDGVLFEKETKRLISYPYGSKQSEYVIPQGTRQIGDCAFLGCENLVTVTIPDSVVSIGDSAFLCCRNLKEMTIPDGITSVENLTFFVCESLTAVTIPNSVISIGNSAFGFCESLKEITIPDSVTSIADNAFEGCDAVIHRGSSAPSGQSAQGWTCASCGKTGLTGNFCTDCGSAKPAETWVCASCGQTDNEGNFCASCGSAKPAGTWVCASCGKTDNTGNFCTNCGNAKG